MAREKLEEIYLIRSQVKRRGRQERVLQKDREREKDDIERGRMNKYE